MGISKQVPFLAKVQIYCQTLVKIIRGETHKLFFKKRSGLLFIGKRVSIYNHQFISVGKNVKFESHSEIQGLSESGVVFEDNVTVGYGTMIRPSSYYGVGHIGIGLEIGSNSSIGPNGFVGASGGIKIGENVMIGPNVTIIAENHNFDDSNINIKKQGVRQKGVTIGDNVWIGANVTILDGVKIDSGVVVGAGTLVNKNIKANSIQLDKRTPVNRAR